VKITEHTYSDKLNILGFRFEDGSMQFWGHGVLPGTDVPTIRCLFSKGFANRIAYNKGKVLVLKYVGEQKNWESLGLKSE
jgi:hypothetical protein